MANLWIPLPRLKELLETSKEEDSAKILKEFYSEASNVANKPECSIRITKDIAGINDFRILEKIEDVNEFFKELYNRDI